MIKATVTSQNEEVVIRSAQTLEERLLQALETGLARGLLITVGVVQREFIQDGPRVKGEFGPGARLHSVTGNLRSKVWSSVKRQGQVIRGQIGDNAKYAAFHEFGFHGVVAVRAHTRVMDQLNAKGQSLPFSPGRVISGVLQTRKESARRQKSGMVLVQYVKAHQRRVNYAGKPFVRPALLQQTPVIREELVKELQTVK